MEKGKRKRDIINTKRFLWADIVRIVAIYFVVQIHVASTQSPLLSLSVICVPLFVMLSGSLLLGKQENYQKFFKNRCLKIFTPWLVWTFIYLIYFYFFQYQTKVAEIFSLHKQSIISQWSHLFFQVFLSNLWFLPLIFSLYLLTPLLRLFVYNATKKDMWYILGLWFLCISVLPFTLVTSLFPYWEPTIVFTAIQYSGYFLLGYMLVNVKLPDMSKRGLILLFVLGILFSLFNSHFLAPTTVIGSVACFLFIFFFSNKVEKSITPRIKKIIAAVSGASFGVYLIHQLLLDIVGYGSFFSIQSPFEEIIVTIIVFIVATSLVLLIKKIPILSYIVP